MTPHINENPSVWSLWDVPGKGHLLVTLEQGVREELVLVSRVDVEFDGDVLVATSRSPDATRFSLIGEGEHSALLSTAFDNHLAALEVDREGVMPLHRDSFAAAPSPRL